MIVLRGYTKIPVGYEDWRMSNNEYWCAVFWQHITQRKYMDISPTGEKLHQDIHCTMGVYDHPVNPSIVLVLDAWIRFFDAWEPE